MDFFFSTPPLELLPQVLPLTSRSCNSHSSQRLRSARRRIHADTGCTMNWIQTLCLKPQRKLNEQESRGTCNGKNSSREQPNVSEAMTSDETISSKPWNHNRIGLILWKCSQRWAVLNTLGRKHPCRRTETITRRKTHQTHPSQTT